MSLKVFVPFEAPATGWDLARVLVVAAVVTMTVTAPGRGHACSRADRVGALDLDTLVTIHWAIVLIIFVFDVLSILPRSSIQGAVLKGSQESKI